MSGIQYADRAARRLALILVAAGALAGALLLLAFNAWRSGLESWVAADLAHRARLVVAVMIGLTTGPALAMSAYLWRLGRRTAAAERYPPPGLRVVRDTRIVAGARARRLGRGLQAIAAALACGGVLLAWLLWRLLSLAGRAAPVLAVGLACSGAVFAQQPRSIPAPDGGVVEADEYGTADRAVVLAHGGRFDRASWRTQARRLVDAGFKVLAIDFRAAVRARAGEDAPCLYDAPCLSRDVLAAVRHLRRSGARTVAVIGASLGGGAAAQAAADARPGEIDRVVLLAHMAIARPEAMSGRKLFVVARDDPGPGGEPRLVRIREQYERAPEPKQLLILGGSAHAQFIFDTAGAEDLMQAILRFLSEP